MPAHLLIVATRSCPGTDPPRPLWAPRKGRWAAGTHRRTVEQGTCLLRGHHLEPIPVLLALVRHAAVSGV